jgi:hypothetical protein
LSIQYDLRIPSTFKIGFKIFETFGATSEAGCEKESIFNIEEGGCSAVIAETFNRLIVADVKAGLNEHDR